jgi:hypothetical protein
MFQCFNDVPLKKAIHYKFASVQWNRLYTNLNMNPNTKRCTPELVAECEFRLYIASPPNYDISIVIKAPPIPDWFTKKHYVSSAINFKECSEEDFA